MKMIGKYIDQILEKKQITQAELARATGFTKTRINEIIKNKRGLSVESAYRISKVLGISARDLLVQQAENQLLEYERELQSVEK